MSSEINAVAVYCGSSAGNESHYREIALALGRELAHRNQTLVYGGARVGLMGAVADGCLSEGGRVIGVLPRFMADKELEHESLTELIWVESMHERKLKMYELADAYVAIPGGFGTMEELFEMLTWGQLGLHTAPVVVYNQDGYYDHLLALADQMQRAGFLGPENRGMLLQADNLNSLFEVMANYTSPKTGILMRPEQT